MSMFKTALLASLVSVAGSIGAAQAGVYSVTVSEGLTNGFGFSSEKGATFPAVSAGSNTAAATFTFTGDIGADNTTAQNAPPPSPLGDLNSAFGFSTSNISNYSGAGSVSYNGTKVADYNTLAGFLASSASASGYAYASTYAVDMGVLAKGTILTITHDDGASVYQGDTRIGSTTSGPTTRLTEAVTLGATADTVLYYGRQNGTPSTFIVSVPEPMSIGLLGTGLMALGLFRRRSLAA